MNDEWDEDVDELVQDEEYLDNIHNDGKSSCAIIVCECRVNKGGKLQYYNPFVGMMSSVPYRITIHNYESRALGFDPTLKSERNYHQFLHLSTLMNMPWGSSVKFRDDYGVVFGTSDVIRLLSERSEEAIARWEVEYVKFKKLRDETVKKLDVEYGVNVTEKFVKKKKKKQTPDDAMEI